MSFNIRSIMESFLQKYSNTESQFVKYILERNYDNAERISYKLYENYPQYLTLVLFLRRNSSKKLFLRAIQKSRMNDFLLLELILKDSLFTYDDIIGNISVLLNKQQFHHLHIQKLFLLKHHESIFNKISEESIKGKIINEDNRNINILTNSGKIEAKGVDIFTSLRNNFETRNLETMLNQMIDTLDDFGLYDLALRKNIYIHKKNTFNYKWYKLHLEKSSEVALDILKGTSDFSAVKRVIEITGLHSVGAENFDILIEYLLHGYRKDLLDRIFQLYTKSQTFLNLKIFLSLLISSREEENIVLAYYLSSINSNIEYESDKDNKIAGNNDNKGNGNQGNGNKGNGNQGNGNQGNDNQSNDNQGNGNKGNGNQGNGNQGNGNQSNGNQSNGNQGNDNQSNGNQSNDNQSNGNQGNGNQSNGNQGNIDSLNHKKETINILENYEIKLINLFLSRYFCFLSQVKEILEELNVKNVQIFNFAYLLTDIFIATGVHDFQYELKLKKLLFSNISYITAKIPVFIRQNCVGAAISLIKTKERLENLAIWKEMDSKKFVSTDPSTLFSLLLGQSCRFIFDKLTAKHTIKGYTAVGSLYTFSTGNSISHVFKNQYIEINDNFFITNFTKNYNKKINKN